MPTFVRTYPVRFEDCDGAGIVFYPRLVLLVNRIIEDWFADGLGVDFRELHEARRLAIPTVDLHLRFVAASRLGERSRRSTCTCASWPRAGSATGSTWPWR
jgi:4-hydroxybenzoyl-CoA thioesterase